MKRMHVFFVVVCFLLIIAGITYFYYSYQQGSSNTIPERNLTDKEFYIVNRYIARKTKQDERRYLSILENIAVGTQRIQLGLCDPKPFVAKVKNQAKLIISNNTNTTRTLFFTQGKFFSQVTMLAHKDFIFVPSITTKSSYYGYQCSDTGTLTGIILVKS